MSLTFTSHPVDQPLNGTLRVPGDKSISHRSIMLGSLAKGTTVVTGFLQGEDSLNTLRSFQAMGVHIEQQQDQVSIEGVGLHGLKAPDHDLYLGNSGTSMRLMAGLLAGQPFQTCLTGDSSLCRRPMGRVIQPLSLMGAKIDAQHNKPPLHIHGTSDLKGVTYDLPIASAQVKSCLLLAGLFAQGSTTVVEPAPTRDHTERMLQGFGYQVDSQRGQVSIEGTDSQQSLTATAIDVPADISSAAFFIVAACIVPGSKLHLKHVGVNPTRIGIIDILKMMGANIRLASPREVGGEPVCDVIVKYASLRGIAIPEALVPLAIDEFPILFIAAACAQGKTILTGAEELRVKESDRIQAMADGLQALGVAAQPTDDGMIIPGSDADTVFTGGQVQSQHDHRIAMAFSVAALRASAPVNILDSDNVNTSFPGFAELFNQVGGRLETNA